jgi:hypothetical protein
MLGLLTYFMAPRSFSHRVSSHTQLPPAPCLPPPPSATGGGGDPGHFGCRGKLYRAGQSARAAAARRKEDRANVLLSRPNFAPQSTPSNHSGEKLLCEAPPATKLPGERIIFDGMTPVAKTPFESSPLVVA